MATFTVPTRATVSENNQAVFDNLEKGLGFVPNIYAALALNETALPDYLAFQGRKTTLKAKEKEVVNLVVSQVNECAYCLAAHTAIGKMNGFDDEQIIEIRKAAVNFDPKIAALANFVKETTVNRGKPSVQVTDELIAAGYNQASVVDILMLIGDKTVANLLHGVTQVPVDFPEAAPLENAVPA